MLNYMRRHAQGTTIKILFWIIIAVFILWGVGSFTGSDSLYAAAVNGESISPKEVRRTATQLEQFYRQLYGDRLTPEVVKSLDFKNRALDQIINGTLLKQEARRLGFSVTDEEVRAAIQGIQGLNVDGRLPARSLLPLPARDQRDADRVRGGAARPVARPEDRRAHRHLAPFRRARRARALSIPEREGEPVVRAGEGLGPRQGDQAERRRVGQVLRGASGSLPRARASRYRLRVVQPERFRQGRSGERRGHRAGIQRFQGRAVHRARRGARPPRLAHRGAGRGRQAARCGAGAGDGRARAPQEG